MAHSTGPYVSVFNPTGQFGALSTYADTPFTLSDRIWPSAEHYFQAQKFFDKEIQELVRHTSTADAAKRLAWSDRLADMVRQDWDDVRIDVMRRGLHAKFAQSVVARRVLLQSWPMPIVDSSTDDNFWGIGPRGEGRNWLGRILEEVRNLHTPKGWLLLRGGAQRHHKPVLESCVLWGEVDLTSMASASEPSRSADWIFGGFLSIGVPELVRDAEEKRATASQPADANRDELLSMAFDRKYGGYSWFEDARSAVQSWPELFFGTVGFLARGDILQKEVVAIGAGAGSEAAQLWRLLNERVTLVDVGAQLVENCKREAPKAKVLRHRAENLSSIGEATMDVYCALRVFDAAYFDRPTALREAKRVLRRRGSLIVSFSNGYLCADGSIDHGQINPKGDLDLAEPWRLLVETVSCAAEMGFEEFEFFDLQSEIGFVARNGQRQRIQRPQASRLSR